MYSNFGLIVPGTDSEEFGRSADGRAIGPANSGSTF